MESSLSTNQLAFIALCNEYCRTLEHADAHEASTLVDTMLHQLPRIYISALDLPESIDDANDYYGEDALDEEQYEDIRRRLAAILGEDDTFLEVFDERMAFSEAPVAQNISELLADIYQVLFNFIENVRTAPESVIVAAIDAVRSDFALYWSHKLCNVLRPLNNIKFKE